MDPRERGISPAPEQRQRWSSRLKDIQSVIKEKNIKVVKELTSGFVVDDKGNYWIFRRLPDGQIAPHRFTTIEKALDQVERVIESKAGFQETIGRYTLDVAGDNVDLVEIGTTLVESSRLFRTLPPETKGEYASEISVDILPKLTLARNVYKKEAAEVLRQIIVAGGEEAKTAKELEKAGTDVFQAAINGIGIISGENIRLMSGLFWLDIWGRRSRDIRGLLMIHHQYLEDLNEAVRNRKPLAKRNREYLSRGLVESLTRDQGIFWKIDHIEGNPFFKRFQSREVRALRILPELIKERNYDEVEKKLEEALIKLRAIRRDWRRAEIRLSEKTA